MSRHSALLHELQAVLTIAYRDIMRFVRNPSRLIGTLILPIIFVAVLGGGFQASYGKSIGYNVLTLVFTGVFALTLFQSTAFGMISLIEDRENDFSQEIFISPISRYSIVFGKIVGESFVALLQGIVILCFGAIVGVSFSWIIILLLLSSGVLICLFGGAFGLLLLSGFGHQRGANQIVTFLIFPQFFLAGVFNTLQNPPWYLDFLSRITPLRYAVDLIRDIYYANRPESQQIVLAHPLLNITVILVLLGCFIIVGTALFIRGEQKR